MRVQSNITSQIRSAQDIQKFSLAFLCLFVLIGLFSFGMQQLYIYQRGQGRDIHTYQFKYISNMYLLRTHICLLYFANNGKAKSTPEAIHLIRVDEGNIRAEHTYLITHSINKNALHTLVSQESTYAIILNLAAVEEEPQYITTEDDAKLIVFYTNQYAIMLDRFYDQYTDILAASNASTGTFSVVELCLESTLVIIFFYVVLRPAIQKFTLFSHKAVAIQSELIETKSLINSTVRIQGAAAMHLALDVVCADHYVYKVASQGSTLTVFYNESAHIFICECPMYIKTKTCFHANRASWLHDRVYRKTF